MGCLCIRGTEDALGHGHEQPPTPPLHSLPRTPPSGCHAVPPSQRLLSSVEGHPDGGLSILTGHCVFPERCQCRRGRFWPRIPPTRSRAVLPCNPLQA